MVDNVWRNLPGAFDQVGGLDREGAPNGIGGAPHDNPPWFGRGKFSIFAAIGENLVYRLNRTTAGMLTSNGVGKYWGCAITNSTRSKSTWCRIGSSVVDVEI